MHLDYYTKGQTLALLVVVLIISFGGQYYFDNWLRTSPMSSAISVNAVKAVPIPYIEGKVTSVSSDGIMVASTIQSPSDAPLHLTVSQNTKIQEGKSLPQPQGTLLMQDYMSKYTRDGFIASYPQLFTSTKSITLSSLKSGDKVMVFLSGAIDPNTKTASAAMITRVLQ